MPASDDAESCSLDLLRFLPPDARVVVDVGRGIGSLVERYRQINPGVDYRAVESPRKAPPGLAPGLVDCLVIGDAHDHVVDPREAIVGLAGWVREGGQTIVCLRSARTHHGDPTVGSIRSLLDAAGFRVFDLQTGPEDLVIRSVRSAAPPRRLMIRTLIGEPQVCGRVRILEPHAFLGTIPGVQTLSSVDPSQLRGPPPGEGDVVIQQRILMNRSGHLQVHRGLLQLGALIVAEFDDEPGISPRFASEGYIAIRGCHCVQTSTEALADSLRRHNPHVKVFANQIASLPAPRTATAEGPVTVFFGALNREPDWAPIMPAINRVLHACGDRVRVRVVHDRAFFDALGTDRKEFEPFCEYERYQQILQTADIALLPLNPSPFNAAKSDLKFIECAAAGAVALASPTVYSASIRHGETGLIAHSAEEFASLLGQLIEDAPLRQHLAAQAYQYVAAQRLLGQRYRERYDWYMQMLDRKPELDRDLRSRVPELFPD